MPATPTDPPGKQELPEAVVTTRRGFSVIWLIPLVAALVGGWIAWKAYSEQGPTITISFKSAEGLVAGKTKIKYKDVEIGQVEAIDLDDKLARVIVTAKMHATSEKYLRKETRFWVVRARVSAGNISGIGTILSGAYIGIDPVMEGKSERHFTGLDTAPAITMDTPGRYFRLSAAKLGSLDVGSPVYYREIKVGEIVSYGLAGDGESVDFRIFIYEPHDRKVSENTRFWNASGFDVSLTAEGISVNTQSLVSLLIGGIAFEVPASNQPGEVAPEDKVFKLYGSRKETLQKEIRVKQKFLMVFNGTVRGLSIGAPLEFRGIPFGKVVDIEVKVDDEKHTVSIPVTVEAHPERLHGWSDLMTQEQRTELFNHLVRQGLRARLKTGSILTGQLYIDLDFYPDAPAAEVDYSGKYPRIPTIPSSTEELTRNVLAILEKLERFPLDKLGDDLTTTLASLDATIRQTELAIANMKDVLSPDAPVVQEAQKTLEELSGTARSLRILADYLERHPEALLRGKQ
ncbi:MAG: MlaD family protein [Gammaproteobacteria bacterium]|jgi:paraquat-inducible protein B